MTCEEIKKLAKEQYGKDITDEQAQAVLEELNQTAVASGELSDDALEAVSGGGKIVSLVKDIFGKIGKIF